MWRVVLALAPAGAWSVWWFGPAVLWVIGLSVGVSVAMEALIQRLSGKPVTIADGSAVVTGLLLAYVLPPNGVVPATAGAPAQLTLLPWYVPVTAAAMAIGVAKHCFGGLGQNIWNPALVGRAFAQVCFPDAVTLPMWPAGDFFGGGGQAVTQATALAKHPAAPHIYSLTDLFLGRCGGCIGEVSALLLLIGGIYLILRKYVDWRLVSAYLLTVFLLVMILPAEEGTFWAESPESWMSRQAQARVAPAAAGDAAAAVGRVVARPKLDLAFYHLFAGGVMLGALFMATDMVTSPLTRKGQVIFGIGCGALTALLRFYSGMPEGVCYSILLMNTACPLIDRYTRPRVFGERRK